MRRQPKINDTKRVEDFNRTTPIGTAVILRDNSSEPFHTRTRSEAWLLGHMQGVVLVEGKTGGWELDRITVKEPA